MTRGTGNPLAPLLSTREVIILDGGLATTLESYGHDLDDPLWSAKVLLEDPTAIREVHSDFLTAGADVITTATYQASELGFAQKGIDSSGTARLMHQAVGLAVQARTEAMPRSPDRPPVLIAASIGPYGAALADGSEYTGRYAVGDKALEDFHRTRWNLLAASDADLLACETLPSLSETRALLRLLDETPDCWAWFSFCCADGTSLQDGTPIVDAVTAVASHERVAAVGINCTAPEHVASLIGLVRTACKLPVIVYPNSGEIFVPAGKTWRAGPSGPAVCSAAAQWVRQGAAAVGGCCRVGPREIRALRQALLESTPVCRLDP